MDTLSLNFNCKEFQLDGGFGFNLPLNARFFYGWLSGKDSAESHRVYVNCELVSVGKADR